MDNLYLPFIPVILLSIELLYFRIARKFEILDRPNDRSMHIRPTIRGGGIVFFMSALVYYCFTFKPSFAFIIALTIVGVVGFMDDLKGMGRLLRFGVQSLAFLLMFYDIGLFSEPIWLVVIVFIIATGTINAYNFMDGINGITGGYSLVAIASLYYINRYIIEFTDQYFLIVIAIGLVVFNYFNFRKKAVCFAGDVGSLSIGFIVIYLIIKLIFVTNNYIYVLLLAVYGVDSVLTIVHRLRLKENIFKPHKLHLYQVIISRTGMPHLKMTSIYMVAQIAVNSVMIFNLRYQITFQYLMGGAILVALGIFYLSLKMKYYSRKL